jgi:dihydroorotate dehydrogenase (fumarate)
MEMIRQVNLAGIRLKNPILNAAGTCKTIEEVREMAKPDIAAVMVGSITIDQIESPSGNTFWPGDYYSLNSAGLANPGLDYYDLHFSEMLEITQTSNKALFFSVAGSSPFEYAKLAEFCLRRGANLVELDLSCPNCWENQKQKPIICFDFPLVKRILEEVEKAVGKEAKIAAKFAPFSDLSSLNKAAKLIRKSQLVKVVTTTNTFPNCLDFDEKGEPRFDRLASMGGPALKTIALGQVYQWRNLLPKRVDIMGCGGVIYGKDVRDLKKAGAKVIQVGTGVLKFGPKVFDRILIELF